jgi:hypothetical protein
VRDHWRARCRADSPDPPNLMLRIAGRSPRPTRTLGPNSRLKPAGMRRAAVYQASRPRSDRDPDSGTGESHRLRIVGSTSVKQRQATRNAQPQTTSFHYGPVPSPSAALGNQMAAKEIAHPSSRISCWQIPEMASGTGSGRRLRSMNWRKSLTTAHGRANGGRYRAIVKSQLR